MPKATACFLSIILLLIFSHKFLMATKNSALCPFASQLAHSHLVDCEIGFSLFCFGKLNAVPQSRTFSEEQHKKRRSFDLLLILSCSSCVYLFSTNNERFIKLSDNFKSCFKSYIHVISTYYNLGNKILNKLLITYT